MASRREDPYAGCEVQAGVDRTIDCNGSRGPLEGEGRSGVENGEGDVPDNMVGVRTPLGEDQLAVHKVPASEECPDPECDVEVAEGEDEEELPEEAAGGCKGPGAA